MRGGSDLFPGKILTVPKVPGAVHTVLYLNVFMSTNWTLYSPMYRPYRRGPSANFYRKSRVKRIGSVDSDLYIETRLRFRKAKNGSQKRTIKASLLCFKRSWTNFLYFVFEIIVLIRIRSQVWILPDRFLFMIKCAGNLLFALKVSPHPSFLTHLSLFCFKGRNKIFCLTNRTESVLRIRIRMNRDINIPCPDPHERLTIRV
jgi:hypothetical protein